MSGRRALGWTLLAGGAVLFLVGIGWGHSGFYLSQAPLLLLLILGGGASFLIGVVLLRRPKQPIEAVAWRESADEPRDSATEKS